MAMKETIDLISSDSETEVDVVGETNQSSTLRKLPNTLSGSGRIANIRGYAELPRKIASYNHGTHALNGHSLSANGHTQEKAPNRLQYNDAVGPSNQNSSRAQKYRDGDGYQHQNVRTFQIGNGFEKISSQQAPTRTLPSSMFPSTSNNVLRHGTQSWDTHGIPYHQAGSSSSYSKSYARDSSGMSSGKDAFMYENSGSRLLPPSLMQARSATATMGGDSSFRTGTGEERAEDSDESRIYQAALENLSGQRNEVNLPDGLLSVPLLRHQKIALAWMLQKENTSLHCWGGILADDQGLGKTVSMISLIQMQRSIESKSKPKDPGNHKTVALDLDDDDDGDNGNVNLANRKTETIALDIDDGDEAKNGTNNNQSINVKAEESDDIKPKPEAGSSSSQVFNKRRPDAGTLVVCPASVLRQWARELDEKVSDKAKLSVLIYHGGSRTKDPVELANFDVVLTTYAIVTNEVPKQRLVDDEDDERNGDRYGLSGEFSNKRKKKASGINKKGKKSEKGSGGPAADLGGTLAKVKWFRVILDEAQTIKNHRTQVARACVSLRAKRRWCLSGTPIQNTIDDLYSYFRFLRYDPYAEYRSFCNTLKLPISRNAVQGYKKLQAVLRAIMLRRTKGSLIDGKPIIDLPPKTISMSRVDFATEERGFYTQLESDSRNQFKAYAAAGTLNQNYANILLMLLRLRQACDHPCLVKQYETDNIGKDSVEMAQTLPQEMLKSLFSLLEASQPICRKCEDPPEDPVVTMCGHVFCYECVSEYLTGDDNICPATGCKEQIGSDVTFSKTTLRRSFSDDLDGTSNDFQFVDKSIVMQKNYSSSKIKALLKILKDNLKQESLGKEVVDESDSDFEIDIDVEIVKHTTPFLRVPEGPIKTIVFSQWTSMLDLVETALKEAHIKYRRLDGQMSLLARDKGVKDFNTNPEVTVMIMSLKAGNLGLNMVAACHVVLLDLWWNPTTEDQAVDRAHRIGQTRPVTVTRLTVKDTVEDRILALQEEKRKMVASAFGEDHSGGSATRLTVDDLKYLFMV